MPIITCFLVLHIDFCRFRSNFAVGVIFLGFSWTIYKRFNFFFKSLLFQATKKYIYYGIIRFFFQLQFPTVIIFPWIRRLARAGTLVWKLSERFSWCFPSIITKRRFSRNCRFFLFTWHCSFFLNFFLEWKKLWKLIWWWWWLHNCLINL